MAFLHLILLRFVTFGYNQRNIGLNCRLRDLSSPYLQGLIMTASTNAHCRPGFAKVLGLLTILGIFAFQAFGQASEEKGIGPHTDTAAATVAEADDSVEHAVPDVTPRTSSITETKRKPTLPVSVLNVSIKAEDGSSLIQAKPQTEESVAVETPQEPSWRPFDHLPRKPRFLKNEDNESDSADAADNGHVEKFHWKPAILQSLLIQGFQHTYALVAQEKTRKALKGPFFRDYLDSVKGVRGWTDGNKFFTNYIAHPMQGGMTGFIFVQNHDRVKKQKFAESKQYWKDRFKAFLWSTAWSTNWELGPISQSSIGNVGLYGHQGYVDLVVTPTVGTGWLIAEEALDRYVIRHIESRGPTVKMLARTFMNPMRSVANLLRFKEPWYRDRPFGH